MSYPCEFKSNWSYLCHKQRLNQGRNDQRRIRAVRESKRNVGDRQILCSTKMSRRFFIIARTLRAVFGKVNGARPSIIDGSFCEKERTKVIQIAATLDNERRDRRVNFHAIYDCIRAYYRIGRNHISRILLASNSVIKLNFCVVLQKKSVAKVKFRVRKERYLENKVLISCHLQIDYFRYKMFLGP